MSLVENPTVAIIGSCGRTGPLFNRTHFELMVAEAYRILTQDLKLKHWNLVSGGAAWSDHVAVALFLQGKGDSLTLHLPCKLSRNGLADAQSDRLHRAFSRTSSRDSIGELNRVAEMPNATVKTWKGYRERNDQVAKAAMIMIAFTWGNRPDSGGTKYTWDKAKCPRKIHVSLSQFKEMEKKMKRDLSAEYASYVARAQALKALLFPDGAPIRVRGFESFPLRLFKGLEEDVKASDPSGDLSALEERFACFAMDNIKSKLESLEKLLPDEVDMGTLGAGSEPIG